MSIAIRYHLRSGKTFTAPVGTEDRETAITEGEKWLAAGAETWGTFMDAHALSRNTEGYVARQVSLTMATLSSFAVDAIEAVDIHWPVDALEQAGLE